MPLNEEYSFDFYSKKVTNDDSDANHDIIEIKNADKMPISADKVPISADKVPVSADKVPISADKVPTKKISAQQKMIFQFIEKNKWITSHQAEILLNVKQRRARIILGEMVELGMLERRGSYRNTRYVLKEEREK